MWDSGRGNAGSTAVCSVYYNLAIAAIWVKAIEQETTTQLLKKTSNQNQFLTSPSNSDDEKEREKKPGAEFLLFLFSLISSSNAHTWAILDWSGEGRILSWTH